MGQLREVERLLRDMRSLGYPKDLVLQILHTRVPDEFWVLSYKEKHYVMHRYLEAQYKTWKDLSIKLSLGVCAVAFIGVIIWCWTK